MKRIVFVFMLSFLLSEVDAQQVVITGTVKNVNGEALAGANVVLKESFKGTSTNSKGEFTLSKVSPQTYTFIISYVGYNPIEETIDLDKIKKINFVLTPSEILSEEVIITATRVKENDPVSFTNISNNEIKENNFGQDIAYLISGTPSIVSTSDAGTGIGYTNFRIRGTDMNRINITVNGIPLNDSESHGVFWVNMPDFLSSVDNIQIQRGVGTSTNGAASFGATLNLQTKTFNRDPYADISSFAGSYNSFRNSISFGTGLINNHFTFDGRLSKITSDGFIDRASSDLNSFYLSGAYLTSKSLLKFNIISGKEITYQAWNGVPKVRLQNDYEGMQRYLDHWLIDEEEYDNLINSNSRTYNLYTYENETDNYNQNHYQLFFSYEFNKNLHLNTAAHYTPGKGYYEQYKKDKDLNDYNLNDLILSSDTITSTDLVQQKWLDNQFYGFVFSLDYLRNNLNLTLGGGWNQYLGNHFGEIIWAQYASNGNMRYRWYDNYGNKSDLNIYTKAKYVFFNKLNSFIDLQIRRIGYTINGIDDDLRDITQEHYFLFFNPKAGVNFQVSDIQSIYATFGIANREPNRSNYTDALPGNEPVHETLYNYELGYNMYYSKLYFSGNLYYMNYKNQLVLTGEINDVGSPIMTNVDKSYRLGLELSLGFKPINKLNIDLNATLSKNKIKNFTEYIDNWDNWETGEQTVRELGETDISFSPNIIANSTIEFEIFRNFTIGLISKFVGKQFIDNTSNNTKMLDSYFVNDLKLSYSLFFSGIKELSFNIKINNILNHEYESNAWVYSYIYENTEYTMDGYFPQAGTNIIAGINLKF
ncbi:MAG: hypothetical protein A2X13_02985 [Bacteroidetes bacterium GWC2_33_15]|nr:MAG: hypothetical protein A2X10_09520 [Bacteroidetes bacterium GWA2_33_15]OFX49583.1 MAG: hypothetical protein A2X13_02985 [Bacteroidetes bacterium GWC2_33_15]OFX63679.1 MAG: hypothetical protein A2X15_01240 [Bacteroidetes bacterium GWB2_32_14]OFX68893.1 MAG: hypothetical protein A2X14_13235 [Bacteroidetes bacterium GWD2_33_33]